MAQEIVGQLLGHYRITRTIERGGMAAVFRATDIHLQREVAVKIFQPGNDEATTGAFFRRFLREAQVVARLDHPNILLVHDYGEQNGLAYLVMPFLSMGSLKHMLQRRRVLPIGESLDLVMQILDALQYAHDRGLIHRDIKPGNILFKTERTPVLADFGLVKEIVAPDETGIGSTSIQSHHSLSNGPIMGTPDYMAPEQIQGNVVPMSDIYSIGIMLYEMLTGLHPFRLNGETGLLNILMKQLYKQPPSPSQINPAIPPALDEAVMRALAKDVSRRYQRPSDFLHALENVQAQLSLNEGSDAVDSALGTASFSREDPAATVPMPLTVPLLINRNSTSSFPAASRRFSGLPVQRTGRRLLLVMFTIIMVVALSAGVVHLAVPGLFAYTARQPSASQGKGGAQLQLPTTMPLPATQTNCPLDGKVRPAILPPLVAQGHTAVVYVANDAMNNKTGGRLLAYDVAMGKTRTIATMSRMIQYAQISGDGQWILFITQALEPGSEPAQIHLVRLDGWGLQTLYCSTPTVNITTALLSPDTDTGSMLLLFNEESTNGQESMYTLHIHTGELQRKFTSLHTYRPIAWPNADELYMADMGTRDQPRQGNVYLLNMLQDGQGQNPVFPIVAQAQGPSCNDFSLSPDRTELFSSHCTGTGQECGGCPPTEGPGTLSAVNLAGGSNAPRVIYSSATLGLTAIRAVTSTTLLFLVENQDLYANQNGLWRVNTDGQGLKRLTSEKNTTDVSFFNNSSPYPWSNASRDGSMYALKTGSPQSLMSDTLLIGSLAGSSPQTIAGGAGNETQLELAGWTVL